MSKVLFHSVKVALLAIAAVFMALSAQPAKAAVSGPTPFMGPLPGIMVAQSLPSFSLFDDNTKNFPQEKAEAKANLDSLGCVTCKIFDTFASATFNGMASIDGQAKGLIPVITSVASVFALFYLGSALVAGDAGDLLGRWQVFWRLCMTVAAASIVLSAPIQIVWNLIYEPLFLIADAVIKSVGAGAPASCAASVPNVYPASANSTLETMSLTTCGAFDLVKDGLATGIAMFNSTPDSFAGILLFVIAGAFICLIYGWLAIVFPLRFIDVVIRLALVSIITPFLVLAATFKPTRGYATIGISNVLNAAAQFALLTVIFKIGSTVMDTFGTEMVVNTGEGSSYGSLIVTTLTMVGIAMVFSGLVKAVPSIAAEFSRSSGGGGGEGGSAAVRAIATPMVVGATAAGGGMALGARAGMATGAAAARGVGGAVGRGLGRGTN